jgi:hypothetical protein
MANYLGYRPEDHKTPHARFYNEAFRALPETIGTALRVSPLPANALPDLDGATHLLASGYAAVENGFCLQPDGAARVAVHTHMPQVQPFMWDWWFGWHGSAANRYKLWHPGAHVDARWQDGQQHLKHYIGRTSLIEEYIGTKLEKAAIQFVAPASLGFHPHDYNTTKQVFICARLGYSALPLDFGWLIHQIREVDDGAEMRSRFWLGGPHIAIRYPGAIPAMLSGVLRKLKKIDAKQSAALLQHCAEEMQHLAAILPGLFAAVYQGRSD